MPSASSRRQAIAAKQVETLRIPRNGIPAPPVHTPLPPQLATRIPGYELLEEIGSGGMGIVYRARHRELNRIVAVKMLRPAAITDNESRTRFRAEAEAVARLQHPN